MARGARSAVALGLLAFACASPTLPLPPPALPTVSVGTEPSTYRLASDKGALPNALVVVVNRNPSLSLDARVDGTFADELGSWQIEIPGQAGDIVDISQESGDQSSPVTSVTLK